MNHRQYILKSVTSKRGDSSLITHETCKLLAIMRFIIILNKRIRDFHDVKRIVHSLCNQRILLKFPQLNVEPHIPNFHNLVFIFMSLCFILIEVNRNSFFHWCLKQFNLEHLPKEIFGTKMHFLSKIICYALSLAA